MSACLPQNTFQNLLAVQIAQQLVACPFRVRHHTKNISALVANAGYIVQTTVGVALWRNIARLIAIFEQNPVLRIKLLELVGRAVVVAVPVCHWDFVGALLQITGQQGVLGLWKQVDVFADKAGRGVLHQSPVQQTRFGQYLKAVANPHYIAAPLGMLNHLVHNGRKAGNGTRAQVVAIGKPAGQKDKIAALEVMVFVPKRHHLRTQIGTQAINQILVAITAGKSDNTELHLLEMRRMNEE